MLPFSLAPESERRVVSTGVGARGLPREGGGEGGEAWEEGVHAVICDIFIWF